MDTVWLFTTKRAFMSHLSPGHMPRNRICRSLCHSLNRAINLSPSRNRASLIMSLDKMYVSSPLCIAAYNMYGSSAELKRRIRTINYMTSSRYKAQFSNVISWPGHLNFSCYCSAVIRWAAFVWGANYHVENFLNHMTRQAHLFMFMYINTHAETHRAAKTEYLFLMVRICTKMDLKQNIPILQLLRWTGLQLL